MRQQKRELKEETGYVSENWKYIGQSYDCPDRCSAALHLFIAYSTVQKSEQELGQNEIINTVKVGFDEAIEMCIDGRIVVNSCVHLIMRAFC